MLNGRKEGKHFLYANRDTKQVDECIIARVHYGYPLEIIAVNCKTNKMFSCYEAFGCYELSEYEEAMKDAQIGEERRIY